MNKKKIAPISLALLLALLASAVCPAQSNMPLPCRVTAAELPDFFGIKLGMPMDEAKKLYAKAPQNGVVNGDDPAEFPNADSVRVPARYLLKNTLGLPLESVHFMSTVEKKVEAIQVMFVNKQTLTSEGMFKKISGWIGVASEMWESADYNGDGANISWKATCDGFRVQFDGMKGFFSQLWIGKQNSAKFLDKPVGDGDR
jgi:hypothetical protein